MKCNQCPIRDGSPCVGESSADARGTFCVWALSPDLVYHAHIRAVSLVEAGRPLPMPTVAVPCVPTPDQLAANAEAEAERQATLAILASCPNWIRVGCGCGENRCAIGLGVGGVVFPPDCLACTARPGNPTE